MNDHSAQSDGSDLHARAHVRMEQGIALLNAGAGEALPEAIRCFDEAIELRRRLPLAETPGFRYGLAAGWINRGDALTRLGGDENLASAVRAHTTAIGLLQEVPADDEGLFLKRLAIAWMNLGVALEEQKTARALVEAVQSYREVIRLLDHLPRAADARFDLVLAGAWINLGNAELRSAGSAQAAQTCTAAEKALSLLAETESKELAAAEAGLKARHVLCQAIAALLAAPDYDPSLEMDLIGRMTDAVEDALRLVQNWEKGGVIRFRPIAAQLFHLGTLVYEKHQPQFLAEYVLEHLDPERGGCLPAVSESWLSLARESLSRARSRIMGGDFAWLATPQGLRRLETLKELQTAEARLQTLRSSAVG